MRLSGIKLAGFKSFVDPTQLPLPSNLSGIVGPNGCGKSNLIDAVRWVLGESSVKTLRGQDSEDVIFNGSRTRKPVSRASAELIFDNADGQVQGPFAAYSEIAVRRELTRDGGSQYYLNGRKCLKRDVTDLFLGTGLGGRNQYAIIEQGMVSRMIEAKPEELRVWLEEAAGISRYKDRRRETESRIRATRENLERLDDLRGEIGKRLDTLRRQAANAEKYRALKDEERALRAGILALKLAALDEEGRSQAADAAACAGRLERATQAHADADAAREQAQTQRDALLGQLGDDQAAVYEAEADAARAEQALAHARQLRALKQQEVDQLERQLADLDRREDAERRRAEQLTADIASLEARIGHAHEAEQQARARLEQADDLLQEGEAQWQDFQARAEAPLLQAEGERVRVAALARATRQLAERHERLLRERAELDGEPLRSALAEADATLASLDAERDAQQATWQALEGELAGLREQRTALESTLHARRDALQAARGRLASLETLQQAALRNDDATYRDWLAAQGLDALPRVADRLGVEPGWEDAVEGLLRDWLAAPLLDGAAAWPPAIAEPPDSGVALVSGAPGIATADHDDGLPRLALRVDAPQAVRDLLHGVRLADSADQARRAAQTLAPGESVLARDGSLFARHWLRLPRRGDAHGGVLARAPQIAALKADVARLQQDVRADEDRLEALRLRQQQAEPLRREAAQRLDALRARHAQVLAQRHSQAVRLEQLEGRIQRLDTDAAALGDELAQLTAEHDAAGAALEALERQAQALRDERQQRQQALNQQRDAAARARSTLTQTTQALSQLQIQLASRSTALDAQRQTLLDIADARAHIGEDRAARSAQAEEHDAPLETLALGLDDAQNRVAARRDALRRQRLRLEEAERALGACQQRLRLAEQARDTAREAVQDARIGAENLRTRRETLVAQLAAACDEAGQPADALQALAGPDVADAEARLEQLLRRIERLGAINLAAIEELREAEERADYLSAQHADLSGALEALEAAIRKIDGETRERFRDTFDRVSRVFRERFPKLFGGGEASLELVGENLLDSGVRVVARPPGKRNSSIHMLSGGEKAMTAVALLLALFELNPAPFCLMDEVDAPLDDANVSRFCEVVREMSANVQFIIITHNKITMELASHLLGVTMQEPGVSRLVSVDVQQAVDLAGVPPISERVTA